MSLSILYKCSPKSIPRQFPRNSLHILRPFSTSPSLHVGFLDLRARSVSQENGYFSKSSGLNTINHSPALQLLRSERDLAEHPDAGSRATKPTSSILLTAPSSSADVHDIIVEEYQKEIDALKAQIIGKEQAWHERFNSERLESETAENAYFKSRLLLALSIVAITVLSLDGLALTRELEEHCPGCFDGNAKDGLFVVGYMKQAGDGLDRWLGGGARRLLTREDMTSAMPKNASRQERKVVMSTIPAYNPEKRIRQDAKVEQRPTVIATEDVGKGTSLWQRLMWASPRNT